MITQRYVGQIGNQLIAYVIGKILAEKTGLRYEPPAFKGKHAEPLVWSGDPFFVPQPTEGKIAEGEPVISRCDQWCDLDAFDDSRPIVLHRGFYQRYELFADYKETIRNDWLRIPDDRFVETDDATCYIHARRRDYVVLDDGQTPPNPAKAGVATTLDEFRACLDLFPDAKRLVVVTDAPADPFHLELRRLGLPVTLSGLPWDQDFLLLASARNVIISQSTFSWLACFLGKAERVVCPVFAGSFWGNGLGLYGSAGEGRLDFPNLRPADEPDRWLWLTENGVYSEADTETDNGMLSLRLADVADLVSHLALSVLALENARGGTIQTPARKMEDLDWFLAFAIYVLSAGKTPREAWELTYGSPDCPKKISGRKSR